MTTEPTRPPGGLGRSAPSDRGTAAVLRRRNVHSTSAGGFLLLASGLCAIGLALPGAVRPDRWRLAFIAVALACAVFGLCVMRVRRRLPEAWILGSLTVVDASIVLSHACLADRPGGRVVAALYVLPTLYVGLFLPRWTLWPQCLAVFAGSVQIMWLGESDPALILPYAGIIVTSAISPAVAVSVLRGRLVDAARQARALSTTDPLTGLVNRRGIAERAYGLVGRARELGAVVGVVVADVDHFKRINDRHGHAVGDVVLRLVAGTVRSCAREADVAVRLGGEEIAVLAATTPDELADLAERIRLEVSAATAPWTVTVSLGVAWAEPGPAGPADAPDPLELLWSLVDQADDLMYVAKRSGRNRVTLPAVG